MTDRAKTEKRKGERTKVRFEQLEHPAGANRTTINCLEKAGIAEKRKAVN